MKDGRLRERISSDTRLHALRNLRQTSTLPYYRVMHTAVDPITVVEGDEKIMLGANNYLGLANHPAVLRGAHDAVNRFGGSATGSPLLNGTSELRLELEHEIAQWHQTEDAIVFPSGYQTNLGTIAGLVGVGDSIVVDTEAHASIQDGARLSGASVRTFRHNDLVSLRQQLMRISDRPGAALVVVDGLYSMRGDLAPVDEISNLCSEFAITLMIDEAHSVGVLGTHRTGAAELYGVEDRIDVRMGALSKGLGATGGFIAGTHELIDSLRLNARAFVFSTAAVPAALGAALAAIRIIRSDEGATLADQALRNARLLRTRLLDWGIDVGGTTVLPSGDDVVAPNVPVVLGDEMRAIEVWRRIYDEGVFTALAVAPAVDVGQALLRMCVMATHTTQQIEDAARIIATAIIESRQGSIPNTNQFKESR
jgi:8-amino-7-oxononanoate synthase